MYPSEGVLHMAAGIVCMYFTLPQPRLAYNNHHNMTK